MSDAQQASEVEQSGNAEQQEIDAGPVILDDVPREGEAEPEAKADESEEVEAKADDEAEETEQKERDEKGRFKKPVQPRIDELTRKAHDAEREAQYWRQRALALQQPAEQTESKPKVEDFDDYADYIQELAGYAARQEAEKVARQIRSEEAKREAADKQTEAFTTRASAAREQYPDYDEVVSGSDVQVANHVQELLLDSELGPHLSYQLAMQPEIAERLNRMQPLQAAKEIARMEDRITGAAATPTPTQPIRRTAAPQPTRPLNSGRSVAPNLETASMDEYVEMRRKQNPIWKR